VFVSFTVLLATLSILTLPKLTEEGVTLIAGFAAGVEFFPVTAQLVRENPAASTAIA
jgi:hypothetical protein